MHLGLEVSWQLNRKQTVTRVFLVQLKTYRELLLCTKN